MVTFQSQEVKFSQTLRFHYFDAVAMRKDKFIKRYSLNSSVVCEICSLAVKYDIYSDLLSFLLYFHTIILHVCTTSFGE